MPVVEIIIIAYFNFMFCNFEISANTKLLLNIDALERFGKGENFAEIKLVYLV